ncbi:MAG: DNA mismatch repair protein MutS, partial [Alphaproteobacteria bacterium]
MATAQKEQPKLTPMMTQYMAIKEAHPDCLLFYRMGDFYEMFHDDAVTAAAVLDITLTKRGKTDGTAIPMCGVPWHSHEAYLARLIKAGHRVAICDQTETPDQAKARAKRDGLPASKALVNRDVVRIVTPGTLTEDNLLDARASNYLACLTQTRGVFGLSWLDLSTGEFYAQTVASKDLSGTLERVSPNEILLPESLIQNPDLFEIFMPWESALTPQGNSLFDHNNAEKHLKDLYKVESIDAFGAFEPSAITSAGALIDYATRTQKGSLPHIRPIQSIAFGSVMEIDAATRRNLEITQTMNGERKGSLLQTIDRT